jgi:deoxyxylulose-5-phosphate synthase
VTFGGLALSVRTALEQGGPAAIRYPNGGENTRIREVFYPDYPDHATAHIGVRTSYPLDAATPLDAVIVTHGRITAEALAAAETLATEGMTVGVQLCEYIKPYDRLAEAVAARLPDGCPVLFLEEEIRAGGFGMMLSDALTRRGSMAGRSYAILAVDDSFVIQERAEPIYRTAGIDAAAICDTLRGLTAVGHQPQI